MLPLGQLSGGQRSSLSHVGGGLAPPTRRKGGLGLQRQASMSSEPGNLVAVPVQVRLENEGCQRPHVGEWLGASWW